MTSDRETAIRTLISEIDAYLARYAGPGIAEVRAGIARWRGGPMREVPAQRIPQTRHIDAALDWMEVNGDRRLAHAIRDAMPYLAWIAYDPYPRDLIGATYAENHCMASLIGQGGQIRGVDFDLGLFGFGPDILYRDHRHAAPELYAPLTGPHGWRFQSGASLDWRSSFQPVWNEPWAHHAFKSGPTPYFCVFGWTKDVNVPAEMIFEPDWATIEQQSAPI
ncbi:MAG: dimethylsulfoniopropionate lyase [Rhizobium sp.]|nr:dimethylsulfoniopropionate lyase [Rhizobium sp.]